MQELMRLVDMLPQRFKDPLQQLPHLHELVEIVLDLGRPAIARFPHTAMSLGDGKVSEEDLAYAVSQVSMPCFFALCIPDRVRHYYYVCIQLTVKF